MGALSGKEEIQQFIFGNLFDQLYKHDCPKTLNIQRAFRDHLASRSRAKLMADELAEKWGQNLLIYLETLLGDNWDGLGIPRPLALLEDGNTVITWKHAKFTQLSGLDSLRPEFFAIADWLDGLTPQDFLIPSVCLLAMIGADPIYVTEGSGDGGVDCIGKIKTGPLRSLCLFIQAKTSSSTISREMVFIEYGKYQMLPYLERYQIYREKLGIDGSSDGVSSAYMIVSNNEFRDSARAAASSLGVFLRSRKQLAYWLSDGISKKQLEKMQEELGQFVRPGGSFTNLAPRVKGYLTSRIMQ